MKNKQCIGCGILIQSDHPNELGYLPLAVVESNQDNKELYCKRCFRLRHYNEGISSGISDETFYDMLHEVGRTPALVVHVVDLFDFNGSILSNLSRLVLGNDILLVGNKQDLLPKSVKTSKLLHWLDERAKEEGVKSVDCLLTSAKNPHSIKELIDKIETLRKGRDVYVVGVTNVGKSTLINAVIEELTGEKEMITTSRFPGTTLDNIAISLQDGRVLCDTPGIVHRHQMAHHLHPSHLQYCAPKKELKPKTYQLNERQTLFIGGLVRFDFISGERQGVTTFFDNQLHLHRTKLDGATDFYQKHRGELLSPPCRLELSDFPQLVEHSFVIKAKGDIAISGLGWICVTKPAKVSVWAPEGVLVVTRPSII